MTKMGRSVREIYGKKHKSCPNNVQSCISWVLRCGSAVDEELVRKFHFGGDFKDGHADQSEKVNTSDST